jgi:hypothetical protein
MDYVATAKKKHYRHSTLLTRDESAAIYIYTMPTELFLRLNMALRGPNRQVLKPWLGFLKLLITALKKLPSTKAKLWRAVNLNATSEYIEGQVYTFWNISSWSTNINNVQPYLGEGGTLFSLETINGKNISTFSAFPDEEEIVLMPGTSVRVRSPPFNYQERLFIIDLEEINSHR